MDLKRKLLYVTRESPKISFLLLVGALILFPLYMMIVISLMSPAQLEIFPWFPTQIEEPHDVNATRPALVQVKPARLRLQRMQSADSVNGNSPTPTVEIQEASAEASVLSTLAGAAAEAEIAIPTNERFYVHLPGVDVDQMQWQVAPEEGKPAVIAEYRAAVVCQISEPEANEFRVVVAGRRDETDQPLEIPDGFVSLLPGLRQRSRMMVELRAAEEARKEASDVLKLAQRIERTDDLDQQTQRRREAAIQYQVAARRFQIAEAAFERARQCAVLSEQLGVAAQDRMAEAENRMQVARRRLAAAANILGDEAEKYAAEAGPAVQQIVDQPADLASGFVADRGEAIAVLRTDIPLTVTRLPGQVNLKTAWTYDLQPERDFVVRPLLSAEQLAEADPGQPLAELVAARDMTLTWSEGAWRYQGLPLQSHLYPGFKLLIEPPAADTPEGHTLPLAAQTVVATAVVPKAMVWRETSRLIVGLAVPDSAADVAADKPDKMPWRIELGAGRWSYPLYGGADEPFVIKYAGPEDMPAARPVDVAAGSLLAEMVVHRDRNLLGLKDVGWAEQSANVFLSLPAGFRSLVPSPQATTTPESKLFAHDTVLGRLNMPGVRIHMDQHYLTVRLDGADFTTGGQWQYPLGNQHTLAVRALLQDSKRADAAASREYSPDNQPYETAETSQLRAEIARLRQIAEQTPADPIIMKRAALANLARAEDRYAALRQTQHPADTIATLVATRPALLIYDGQWLLDGLPIAWPAGFRPLDEASELLSENRRQALVQPGDVLARLRAETPHPSVAADAATLVTQAQLVDDGQRLSVSFEHQLPMPVRSIVKVRDGQQIAAGSTVLSLFTPMRFDLENYREAWGYVKDFILNTVVVVLLTVFFSLLFASMSAFVFSRFEFPGKAILYTAIIVLLMIPGVLNLVPLYVIVKNLGLLESTRLHAALVLVLPAIAGGQVMSVYIMRNNLETLAKDLFDAAKIDGASNWQTYWHIAVPLSKPIMGTLAIFVLLSQWNNFIWPWLVIKEERLMPVTAGLAKLEGQHLSDYGLQMAGAVLASLPLMILFFFMMNLFIRGMQSGAIKA